MKIENPTSGTVDDILIAMEFALSGTLKLRLEKGRLLWINRNNRFVIPSKTTLSSADSTVCGVRVKIKAKHLRKGN